MLAQALTHTISHLMENEGEKKERYGRGKSARTNPLHLSHLHRITHAHSPATFALFLSLFISICWIRFVDYRQTTYPHNEVKYKDDSKTTSSKATSLPLQISIHNYVDQNNSA